MGFVVSYLIGFKNGVTYEQYTGSLRAESSSLDSSMNGSESHTRWAWEWHKKKKQTHYSPSHNKNP